mmetsp:Transcript_6736/g.11292  ORF Transcript_6736/g.11292 Transcript_6736/m.11292 type:complete len:280 (+) Transcript_6736:312-1151(+)
MGKGTGKGSCNNGGATDFKTEEGRCAGCSGTFVVIMESIGACINCAPACVMCAFPCCGCCWCCLVLLSSWSGIFGGSVPLCCAKNSNALMWLMWTSIASFVVRGVVIGALSALIDTLQNEIDEYDKCRKEGKSEEYCEDQDLLEHEDRVQQWAIVWWATFALVVTCIWSVVSIVGLYFGKRGFEAELKAEQEERRTGGVSHGGVVAMGTATGGQVVIAQAQAIPVHLVQPVVQINQGQVIQPSQPQQQQPVMGSVVVSNNSPVHGSVVEGRIDDKSQYL